MLPHIVCFSSMLYTDDSLCSLAVFSCSIVLKIFPLTVLGIWWDNSGSCGAEESFASPTRLL